MQQPEGTLCYCEEEAIDSVSFAEGVAITDLQMPPAEGEVHCVLCSKPPANQGNQNECEQNCSQLTLRSLLVKKTQSLY